MVTTPTVIIPEASYKKIMYYIKGCDTEISGFFDVVWDKELKSFMVGEVYLLDQTVTGTETEMDEDAIARFNHTLIKSGVKQLPRGWWHSHVNMGAFWSGTDDKAMDDLKNDTFTISIVGNKRSEFKVKLNCYYPFEFAIDDLKLEILEPEETIPASIVKEIAKKVKVKAKELPTPSPYGETKSYPNHNPWGYDRTKYNNHAKNATLPKDKMEALTKIEQLGLIRKKQNNGYVYEDLATGTIWKDVWESVTEEDYREVMGFNGAPELFGEYD